VNGSQEPALGRTSDWTYRLSTVQKQPCSNPGAAIRAARAELGWLQKDLADRLEVTQVFISQLELGKVYLPSADVRAGLARELGVDPYTERAAERDGKLSLSEASRRHGIDIHALLRFVAAGAIRARPLGNGLGYEVNETELAEDLSQLQRCPFEGCEEPKTGKLGCAAHGHQLWAIEARGKKRTAEVCQAISDGLRGKPRPDSARRIRRLHAAKRLEAEKVKGELGVVEARDLAEKRGVKTHTVVARASTGLLDVVRVQGVQALGGRERLFFRLDDADWPERGDTGRRMWKLGEGFAMVKIALSSDRPWKHWRKRWLGAAKLAEVSEEGRHRKGEPAAREAITFALAYAAAYPAVVSSRSRNAKKALIHHVMKAREGQHVLSRDDGLPRSSKDPVYEKARKRAERALSRGYKLERPAELQRILG
jgi:transcriptional regulator with XRE-family HTH domain